MGCGPVAKVKLIAPKLMAPVASLAPRNGGGTSEASETATRKGRVAFVRFAAAGTKIISTAGTKIISTAGTKICSLNLLVPEARTCAAGGSSGSTAAAGSSSAVAKEGGGCGASSREFVLRALGLQGTAIKGHSIRVSWAPTKRVQLVP